MTGSTSTIRLVLGWAGLLVIAWLAYRPGLSGGFLFDDWVNLDALGRNGAIDNGPALVRYLTSGTADPLGRPLALLSFLVDARNWPADPAPFLRTNLLLHLANASLLWCLLRRLETLLGSDGKHAGRVALLGAGAWLLHPLWVSTTLYAVQREAMLPATFVLAGLLAYVAARERFSRTSGREGAWAMIAAVTIATTLAALSKANGLLLPLLAWVLEATVLRRAFPVPGDTAVAARLRHLRWLLLVIPSLALMAYVARFIPDWNVVASGREWTIGQRALSEPRVILQYLELLLVPRASSAGLFNDQVQASASLFSPATTALGLLALAAMLAGFLRLQHLRRAPALTCALGFFLAGHLLESTLVPLELYFEHRNYLPALLLGWPLARALTNIERPVLRVAASAAVLALFAFTTHARASVWGDPSRLSAMWARQNPASPRAQAGLSITLMEAGRADQALALLQPLRRRWPLDLQVAVNHATATCAATGELPAHDRGALGETFAHLRLGNDLLFRFLASSIDHASAGACRGVDFDTVSGWLRAASANPKLGTSHRFEQLEGRLAIARGEPEQAIAHFTRALQASRRHDDALRQLAWLAAGGHANQALIELDRYQAIVAAAPAPAAGMPRMHAWVLSRQRYWEREFGWMRESLRRQAAAR